MKPEADHILGLSAMQMLGQLSPLLPEGYPQGTASLVAFMMMLSAQEYERAAEIRATENADMRALFAELASQIGDAELKAKLEAAAKTKDSSLKISALDAANYDLRKILIALHEYADAHETRDMSRKIWGLLKNMANARALKMPSP